MSREIKLRVWNKTEKRFLLDGEFVIDAQGGLYYLGLNGGFRTISQDSYTYDVVIQQFTGVLDKSGAEIYEGDILNGHYFGFNGNETDNLFSGGRVISSQWATFGIGTDVGWFEFCETSHFEEPCLEVIGNIFQNPESLKS